MVNNPFAEEDRNSTLADKRTQRLQSRLAEAKKEGEKIEYYLLADTLGVNVSDLSSEEEDMFYGGLHEIEGLSNKEVRGIEETLGIRESSSHRRSESGLTKKVVDYYEGENERRIAKAEEVEQGLVDYVKKEKIYRLITAYNAVRAANTETEDHEKSTLINLLLEKLRARNIEELEFLAKEFEKEYLKEHPEAAKTESSSIETEPGAVKLSPETREAYQHLTDVLARRSTSYTHP